MAKHNANPNITHINAIEGLISQVDGHLNALDLDATNSDERRQKKILAIEEIDLFEKTTLLELRNAFE